MKKILLVFMIILAVAIPVYVLAAETFTITREDKGVEDFGVTRVYWKADASGDKANATIPDGYVNGRVIMIVTNPGAVAPADNYDLTILDQDGVDIAGGTLANRDTANSEAVQPLAGALAYPYGRPVIGPMTVTFTTQANANCDGEIVIFSAK